jgi:hypothetical protein
MSNGIFGGNIFQQADSAFVNPPARRMTVVAASGLGGAGVLTGNIFQQADSPFVNPPARGLSVEAASGFGIFDGGGNDAFVEVDMGQPRLVTRRTLPAARRTLNGLGCGCGSFWK